MRHRPLLSLLAASLLCGCSTISDYLPPAPVMPDLSMVGLGQPESAAAKTTGLAVSDEPFAAKAGSAILAQGGSAADAVAAMFFTLSVTYPVAAGLGGGGICLVRDAKGRSVEFDFLARAANSNGPYAVPGAVAGFYDLQKAFGTLPWQRDVAPAEAYAATGFPISHVLAERLAVTQTIIANDAGLAAEFMADGGLKPEGSVVTNQALSVTMSTVRLSGSNGFYQGALANSIATGAGNQIVPAELAGYRTALTQPRLQNRGGVSIMMPGASTGAGAFIASLLSGAGGGDLSTSVMNGLHHALDNFHVQSVPPDLGSTGFAALDANGQAAACAMTMNGPFGSGHTAGDTGMLLAASPTAPAGIAGAFLTPMMAIDGASVALAGAGSGGPNGSAAMAYAVLKRSAGQSVSRPGDLRSTGLAPFATVNTIACQDGLCVALPDPGGNGLGASAPQPVASN
jgi:gamma-glutamyltranspeptidase/glutathione hydrolase